MARSNSVYKSFTCYVTIARLGTGSKMGVDTTHFCLQQSNYCPGGCKHTKPSQDSSPSTGMPLHPLPPIPPTLPKRGTASPAAPRGQHAGGILSVFVRVRKTFTREAIACPKGQRAWVSCRNTENLRIINR